MSRPIIEVRNLAKRYKLGAVGATSLREEFHRYLDRLRGVPHPDAHEFWALRDVSFDVQPGEVVGIIGRNGAGKSTLLKILSRITEPTSGTAKLRGRVASLLEVGTGFHPELTGRENIFLNGALLGMSRAEVRAKFDEIVAFAEVDQFIDTPVKRYSSGMYVRLAFAVAAHLEPEILIVDEVLAVGDAAFQKKCLGKMNEVSHNDGRTVFFVSHNMGIVRSLCPRVVWLESGGIKSDGLVGDVLDRYLRSAVIQMASAMDVSSIPRASELGQRARIVAVTFNRGGHVRHGEPLEIEFAVTINAAVSDLSVGLGFSSLDGVRIYSCDSDLPGSRENIQQPGTLSIRGRIDTLHLQPGLYLVDIGARSGDFNAIDYVGGAFQIEVIPGPATPGSIIRQGGGVRHPSSWDWGHASSV